MRNEVTRQTVHTFFTAGEHMCSMTNSTPTTPASRSFAPPCKAALSGASSDKRADLVPEAAPRQS